MYLGGAVFKVSEENENFQTSESKCTRNGVVVHDDSSKNHKKEKHVRFEVGI